MVLALSQPKKLTSMANARFDGKKGFCTARFSSFLSKFAQGYFAGACAFPDRQTGRHDIAARLTQFMNGGDDIYLSLRDINFVLEALKGVAYKKRDESGQYVTAYPQLISALAQAKTNIALYASDEMQACLARRFDKEVKDIAANAVNRASAPISAPTSAPIKVRSYPNIALVKA